VGSGGGGMTFSPKRTQLQANSFVIMRREEEGEGMRERNEMLIS